MVDFWGKKFTFVSYLLRHVCGSRWVDFVQKDHLAAIGAFTLAREEKTEMLVTNTRVEGTCWVSAKVADMWRLGDR